MKELEIYIHIPFCVRKCNYCDFLSAPATEEVQNEYMEALEKEIKERSSLYASFLVSTVFFGGGTPSLVPYGWIERILMVLRENYLLSPDAEISMEINPGTVKEQALRAYFHAGINRLSIGLQSAQEEELKCLGRIHDYNAFEETYYTARKVGFQNINVDIMSGLPMQTMEGYKDTLRKVTFLTPPPEHISAYSLIVEEGTLFYEWDAKGELKLPEEEAERAMYQLTEDFLTDKGYYRYEISNYARKGRECKHNVGYWTRKNYVGFGIGAASLIENRRFQNTPHLMEYIHNPLAPKEEERELSLQEQMEETLFLGLRMMQGVSVESFRESFGCEIEEIYKEVIEKHEKNGLLEKVTDKEGKCYLRLTQSGIDVSNIVMADFLL